LRTHQKLSIEAWLIKTQVPGDFDFAEDAVATLYQVSFLYLPFTLTNISSADSQKAGLELAIAQTLRY
jgi:hypothetical protein